MLNILRKKAQSTVIQFMVLMIAIVFIFWGVGTNLGSKRNALATVNGTEIPFEDYQRAYESMVDNLRVQFGGNIPRGFLEGVGMKQQVLNQLIQAEILRQGGRKMGLGVSEVETREEIQSMDVFLENGRFDLDRYRRILSQNRMTPSAFEAGLQRDLLTRRVTEKIEQFALLPESEVQFRFDFANEQVKLAYAAFKPADYIDQVEIKEDALAEWFKENKTNYLGDPKIRLKYLFFDFAAHLDQVEIPDEELRARYQANIQQYVSPEQRRARHILFKVSESDSAEERAAKMQQAQKVLQLAREGKDFAELAKEYSEGPTASQGGDLGFFGRGAMVPQFETAVFAMEPGDISDIVETVFGYHIIKLEEIRPEQKKSFEEVKDSIAAELKKGRVKEITREKAKKAYEEIIRSGSIEKYSARKNEGDQEVLETDYFAKSSPPGPPLTDPKLLNTAFQLKEGELSSLVPVEDGYAILFVDDIQPPAEPELDEVREQVTKDYTAARSVELAREAAETALEQSREAGTLSVEASSGGKVEQSGFIKRSNPTDSGGVPVQIVQKSFELTNQEPFPEQPFGQGDTFYIFQLLEKREGEETLDQTQRTALTEQLTQSVQNRLLADWLAWMESSADVTTNLQLLQ